ncbi:MAG: hypothetical protein OXC10_08860 [Rhodospirillaceae bacterium]|nr:hypothetical protein [Rhodospirillaceae bacterium]
MAIENPFAALAADVSPVVMQIYVIVMILFVAGGTLFDILHKQSARYFFRDWRNAQDKGTGTVGGGQVASLAVKTVASEIATSSEFCNARRRVAHLLTMYGFLAYAITTAIMVFGFTDAKAPTPPILPILWTVGALMVCVGGYWFWFFIRADVSAEGHSPFRIIRADLFILSLLSSTTFGLIWSFVQPGGSWWSYLFLALYLIATTVLFGSVPWSKFSHMFFKPAAALQKRVNEANGTRRNLPAPADRPATFGSARRQPNHY